MYGHLHEKEYNFCQEPNLVIKTLSYEDWKKFGSVCQRDYVIFSQNLPKTGNFFLLNIDEVGPLESGTLDRIRTTELIKTEGPNFYDHKTDPED